MDSIKSLMDKQQYDLVLKLTENTEDVDSLFYRISAFLGLAEGEKALECLQKNRKLLEKRLHTLIKIHMDLLFILGKFDEAYEELNYYQNLPYVSQEVEELLLGMHKQIHDEEIQSYNRNTISDDEIRRRLNSADKDVILSALDLAGSHGIDGFFNEIQNILVNNPHQSIRSFALMLLVQKKVHREFVFKSKGEHMKVVPANTKPPFIGEPFNRITKRMIDEYKNPALSDNAIDIFSGYIIDIYPNEVNLPDDYIVGALYLLSCDCLHVKDNPTFEEYATEHNLDGDLLGTIYNTFADIVTKF